MPKKTADWLIFDCPSCRRTVKMSGDLRGQAVACPFCHSTIEPHQVPAGRPASAPAQPSPKAAPEASSPPKPVPAAPNLRSSKASWELNRPGTRPAASPISASETPAPPSRPALAGSETPQLHRRLTRREDHGHDPSLPHKEDAAAKMAKRPSRRHRRKKRMRLLMMLVTVLLTGTAITLWLLPSKKAPLPQAPAAAVADTALPKLPPATPGSATITETEYQQITATIDKFAAATTLDSLQDVVRDSDRVRPLINQWMAQQAGEPLVHTAVSPRAEIVKYNGLYAGYLEKRGGERHIFAVEPGATRWFFDLECYLGWCEVPWGSLAETRPTQPVLMRALVQPGTHYAGPFANEDTHACFRLQSLDRQHSVYAYIERSTPLFSELQSRTRSAAYVPGLVKIRFLDGADSGDQAILSEWVATGWSLPRSAAETPQNSGK